MAGRAHDRPARSGRPGGAPREARQESQPALFEAPTDAGPPGSAGAPARGRLVLIDGHALAFRAYFALRRLSTSRGVPTNAVYGFVRALLDELRHAKEQDRVVVAFDAPTRTFRHERFDGYKAQRRPAPADLPTQLRTIKHLVDLLGVPRLEQPGLEADDLIATLATRAAAAGFEVEIVTSDRDALQLVSERVRVRTPDARRPLGPAEVEAKHGVRPEQWVDFRALTGDPSDNIPGVPGIGPVAARELLQRYGTLDAVLERLDEVEPRRYAEKIAAALPALELSRELSRLVVDAALPFGPEGLERREVRREELTELLRALEFGSVLRELGLTEAVAYREAPFDEVASAAGEPWSFGYVLDAERPTEARIVELAIARAGAVGVAEAPFARHLSGVVNAPDAKALVVAARRAGADAVPGDDPLLMAHLLDGAAAAPEALARRLGAGEWGDSAASRAVVGAELLTLLDERLTGPPRRVYEDVEKPLQAVLADMELAGIKLDLTLLAELSADLAARLEGLEARLRVIADDPGFNVASRDQVADLLYRKLGLRPGRRTATGKLSTAVSALEPLTGQHEAVDLILEHRELAKLKNTYLEPLAALADERGRVHTTFQQAVVATGRLSSVNPNLQNVPVRSALGREVRRAFVAEEGALLLVADYSQIELRVLAHIADEPALVAAFQEGADVHAATAASIYGVELEAVTPDMRRIAKIINFGVLYGMGPQRLAYELNIPFPQAERYIGTYFARYPRVRRYIDETLARGRELGYVETLLGRRRSVLELRSGDRAVREAAERMTYNMPVQGTAADIMKIAMLRVAPALAALGGRLLLQVHDEIVAEVPEANAERAAAEVGRLMSEAYPLRVPLVASVGLGRDWLAAGG